jgi:hypothetical protein
MKEIIQQLRKAKMAHKRWVGHASAMIEGIPISKDQVPINYTDCVFGNWYYDAGQKFSSLQEFKAIEDPHTELHQIYMEIFKILFEKKKRSFFSKLIGKSAKVSEQDKQLARAKFRTLEEVSKNIVSKLDALEARLKNLGAEEVSKFY